MRPQFFFLLHRIKICWECKPFSGDIWLLYRGNVVPLNFPKKLNPPFLFLSFFLATNDEIYVEKNNKRTPTGWTRDSNKPTSTSCCIIEPSWLTFPLSNPKRLSTPSPPSSHQRLIYWEDCKSCGIPQKPILLDTHTYILTYTNWIDCWLELMCLAL